MLSMKIKCLRFDGGGEYVNNNFKKLLHECGIVHQLACPHTPEQNGCAERKHRHVVETGLALLFNASMPLHYWADAFSIATYLINRMPMRFLNFSSPWQQLFGNSPNYMTLKVFGCACYPWLRPYSKHKLEPRTTQCVFIGYSLNYKGYRCLDLSSGRLYLSRHVVFDESFFPFASVTHTTNSSSKSPLVDAWLPIFTHPISSSLSPSFVPTPPQSSPSTSVPTTTL